MKIVWKKILLIIFIKNTDNMYIVIEWFDRNFPVIVTNEEGYPLIFETIEEAQQETENCQNGKGRCLNDLAQPVRIGLSRETYQQITKFTNATRKFLEEPDSRSLISVWMVVQELQIPDTI